MPDTLLKQSMDTPTVSLLLQLDKLQLNIQLGTEYFYWEWRPSDRCHSF